MARNLGAVAAYLGIPLDIEFVDLTKGASKTPEFLAMNFMGRTPAAQWPVTLEFAECLGICDHAPAALADDGRVYGPLDEAGVDAMLDELKKGRKDQAPHI